MTKIKSGSKVLKKLQKANEKKLKKIEQKTPKKKLKNFNVFYTPVPYEVEMEIKAFTLEEAVQKVKDFLGETVHSVKGGWELMTDKERAEFCKQYEEKHG